MENVILYLNKAAEVFWSFSGAMLIQSSILIVLLLVIDRLIRKRVRAVFRYCIWMLVFVKLLLPPSLCLPTGIGYWCGFNLWPQNQQVAPEEPVNMTQQQANAVDDGQEQFPPTPEVLSQPVRTQVPAVTEDGAYMPPVEASELESPSVVAAPPASPAVTLCWQSFVLLGWLVGVLVLSVLLIQRFLFVRSLIAQSDPAEGQVLETLNQCRRQVGYNRPIQLRLTANMLSPAACGLLNPVILMPASLLDKLTDDKLKTVLIHELAHIKRGDLWVNFLQTVLQIAYFYNPLLWVANAMVRGIREKAVDEMVLTKLGDQADSYSNTLIDIAEIAFSKPHFSLRLVGVVESKKALTDRIKHILSRPFPKSAKIGIVGLVAIFITAAVLLPMAKGEKEEISSNDDLEKLVIENFIGNRDRLESCVLSWTRSVKDDGFTKAGRAIDNLEYGGTYQLWWDGKKTTTKYTTDQICTGTENSGTNDKWWIQKESGGNTYGGHLFSSKPSYTGYENWLEQVIHWYNPMSLDKGIKWRKKRDYISMDWSIVKQNGAKLVKLTAENIDSREGIEKGARSIEFFDASKNYSRISCEWYDGSGRLYMKETRRYKEVIPNLWFPAEVHVQSFGMDGKAELSQRLVLNLDQCRFNDPKAVSEEVFGVPLPDEQATFNLQKQVLKTAEVEVKQIYETLYGWFKTAVEKDYEQHAQYVAGSKYRTSAQIQNSVKEVHELMQFNSDWSLSLVSIYWVDDEALAVADKMPIGDPKVGTQQVLVFTLKKQDDRWVIDDIDLEELNGLQIENSRFLKNHPDAKVWYEEPGPPNVFLNSAADSRKTEGKSSNSKLETNNYTATLPNGVTVELVGVCEYPSEGKQWWRPDGKELNITSNHSEGITDLLPPGSRPLEFLVNVMCPDGINFEISTIHFECPRSHYKLFEPNIKQAISGNLVACRVSLLTEADTCDIEIGLWTEDWQTKASSGGDEMILGDDREYAFSKPIPKPNGSIGIVLSHDPPEGKLDQRLVAITNDGNVHKSSFEKRTSTAKLEQYQVEFNNVSLDDIKEFRFQTRPFNWIPFKNIALRPGGEREGEVDNLLSKEDSSSTKLTCLADAPNSTTFIDLETGGIFYLPDELLKKQDGEKILAWAKEKGVDLSVRVKADVCYIGHMDAFTWQVANESWDSMTPEQIKNNPDLIEREVGYGNITRKPEDLPRTYLFKTGQSGFGILQITEFTENPAGIKIRYKLISDNSFTRPGGEREVEGIQKPTAANSFIKAAWTSLNEFTVPVYDKNAKTFGQYIGAELSNTNNSYIKLGDYGLKNGAWPQDVRDAFEKAGQCDFYMKQDYSLVPLGKTIITPIYEGLLPDNHTDWTLLDRIALLSSEQLFGVMEAFASSTSMHSGVKLQEGQFYTVIADGKAYLLRATKLGHYKDSDHQAATLTFAELGTTEEFGLDIDKIWTPPKPGLRVEIVELADQSPLRPGGEREGEVEGNDTWGEAVEGVKIGITEATRVFGRSDWVYPVVRLKLQARNDGQRYLSLPENGLSWQIEVDGDWYEWVDPRLLNPPKNKSGAFSLATGGPLLEFNSGDSHSNLMVEVAGNWRKIPTGKEVELAQRRWGTWPIFEEYGKELIFKEGRTYQIRIAIPCQPGRAGRWDIHRPVSNQVEVEITPASLRPGGEREGEVSIDDGQSTTDEGMEADNDVDNEIRGLAESIFTAIRKADLDRISALFGNLALAAEVSGCGQKWDVSNVQTGEMCLSDKDALLVSTEIYHHQLYTQQIKREAEAKEIRIGLKIHDGKWIAWFVELGQAGDRGKIENFLRKHPEAKNVSLRPGGEREGETEEGIDLVGSVEAQNANPLSYPSALELAHAFMKLSQNGDVKTGELFTEKMTPECVRLLDWCGGTSVRAEIEAEFSRMRSEFQAGLTEEQKQFYSTVRIWQDRGRDVTQNDDRAYVRLLNSKQKGKHWIRTLLLKKQANGSWRITGLYYNTGQLQNDNGIKYFLLNTPATDPAWGDIIEFKISEPRIANGCYIDFDNQKLYDIPQGSVNKQWFAQMGIDGKCGSEQVIGGGGLKGIDLLTKSVDFSKDFPPPKNILLISDQWMRLGSGTGGPLFFKTREGKIGIMIVGGVAKDYDIRFKMLESGNTEGEIETQSSVPSPQSSGEMEAKIQGEAPKGSVFVQVEPLYSADDAKKGIYRWSVRPPDGFVLDLTQHTSHYGT